MEAQVDTLHVYSCAGVERKREIVDFVGSSNATTLVASNETFKIDSSRCRKPIDWKDSLTHSVVSFPPLLVSIEESLRQ